jgi:hypothetical protein
MADYLDEHGPIWSFSENEDLVNSFKKAQNDAKKNEKNTKSTRIISKKPKMTPNMATFSARSIKKINQLQMSLLS